MVDEFKAITASEALKAAVETFREIAGMGDTSQGYAAETWLKTWGVRV